MLPNSIPTQLGSTAPAAGSQFAPATSETPIVVKLLNFGFPCEVIVAGPMAVSNGPTGLLGKAVMSCWIPVGVGTKPGDVLGEPPVRVRSKLAEPKNQIRSFQMGPPTEPPNRLSTYWGTTGLLQGFNVEETCP